MKGMMGRWDSGRWGADSRGRVAREQTLGQTWGTGKAGDLY